jgi:hypothetical protein
MAEVVAIKLYPAGSKTLEVPPSKLEYIESMNWPPSCDVGNTTPIAPDFPDLSLLAPGCGLYPNA